MIGYTVPTIFIGADNGKAGVGFNDRTGSQGSAIKSRNKMQRM
jgi:hypothetical protein